MTALSDRGPITFLSFSEVVLGIHPCHSGPHHSHNWVIVNSAPAGYSRGTEYYSHGGRDHHIQIDHQVSSAGDNEAVDQAMAEMYRNRWRISWFSGGWPRVGHI